MKTEEAAELLAKAHRVLVIGSPGSGKSTLSQVLARQFDLPYIPMDRAFFWLPGWRMRPREEIRTLIDDAISADRWLIDGTGLNTLELRLTRANLVIWLRLPRRVCMWRLLRRWLQFHGRTRPDMADDCPERVDLRFLRYVWTFDRDLVPQIEHKLAAPGVTRNVIHLTTQDEIDALLAEITVSV